MADPLDLFAIEKILENIELEVEPVISSEKSVMNSFCPETKPLSMRTRIFS